MFHRVMYSILLWRHTGWGLSLRFVMTVLGHVRKHVPRHVPRHVPVKHVLEHVPGHMLKHVPKHVPDRHVLDRHVPEHMLARHVLGLNKIGVNFYLNAETVFSFFQNSVRHSVVRCG